MLSVLWQVYFQSINTPLQAVIQIQNGKQKQQITMQHETIAASASSVL